MCTNNRRLDWGGGVRCTNCPVPRRIVLAATSFCCQPHGQRVIYRVEATGFLFGYWSITVRLQQSKRYQPYGEAYIEH